MMYAGALEIGVLTSCVLLGITITQTYVYWSRFKDDSVYLKALVSAAWLSDLAHGVCIAVNLYGETITDAPLEARLVSISPSLSASVLFSSLAILLTQGFFAYRIYTFSKRMRTLILSTLMLLIGACFSTLFAVLVATVVAPTYAEFIPRFGWLAMAFWICSTVTDVVIAVMLVFLLHRTRSRARGVMMKRSLAITDKLILWSIESGVVTSMFSVVTLISFITMKRTFIWLALIMNKTKVFTNSLLASLNSRATLREIGNSTVVDGTVTIPQLISLRAVNSDHPNTGDEREERESIHAPKTL
ncbi:hypothetical protein MKEN_01445900 [Mycena kentingensis (nom. inval.)]|nr:hypothetical protein MKEN_01445900 [Mycena kentingensis (nom. inval.)]